MLIDAQVTPERAFFAGRRGTPIDPAPRLDAWDGWS